MPMLTRGTIAARIAVQYRASSRVNVQIASLRSSVASALGAPPVAGAVQLSCSVVPNPFAVLWRKRRLITQDDWHLLVLVLLDAARDTSDASVRSALEAALTAAHVPTTRQVVEFLAGNMPTTTATAVPPPATLRPTGSPAGYAFADRTSGPGERGFVAPVGCSTQGSTWADGVPAPEGRMPTRRVGPELTGTAFAASLQGLSETAREEAIYAAAMRGQIPGFLRDLVEIQVQAGGHTGTYRVMPDVLAIGTDADYLRVPLRPGTAQRLADAWGMVLPTPKIVDDIASHAQVKLVPRPLTPARGERRSSTRLYVESNRLIQEQKGDRTGLVSGAKKHVVISPSLATHPRSVLIYGWYYPTLAQAQAALGARHRVSYIQPHSWVHADSYVDYSHGIQLVAGRMVVDGVERSTDEVLKSRDLSPLLSNQGALRLTRYI